MIIGREFEFCRSTHRFEDPSRYFGSEGIQSNP